MFICPPTGGHIEYLFPYQFTLMATIRYETYKKLKEMGREPIDLPADINFAGDITLQKKKGRHHKMEFRNTGTYYHPNLCAQRLREAEDRLKRFQDMKISNTELKLYGDDENKLSADVDKAFAEYKAVLSGDTDNADIKEMHKIVFGGRKMNMVETALKLTSLSNDAPAPSKTTIEKKEPVSPSLNPVKGFSA